jgi:3-oxoacyl-[acyl-carrier-protein] synthase II
MSRDGRAAGPRVVVTGLGPVSSIGVGVAAYGQSLRAGRVGVSEIRSFDATGFPHRYAGEVRDFEPGQLLGRLDLARWGRSSQFAATAARLAVRDASLSSAQIEAAGLGVVMGTTSGESQVIEELTARAVAGDGGQAFPPEVVSQLPAARLAYAASEELAAPGLSVTLANACSASNYAIGYAYDILAGGEAEAMVAGGADSVCRWAHAGFYRLGALSDRTCSPFDRDRTGILTAEGGVALVLETLDHARARDARIYAEVLGYGLNCDARHMVAPDAERIADCMRLAHANAGIKPADVGYICAHGTGTAMNDHAEAEAVRMVFGGDPPPMSSIKSMLGHAMGAASGFGAAAAVLAIHDGFLPPTMNWANPDPRFDWLDPVPNHSRPAQIEVAQNNGFAFGGNNCITVFGTLR